MALFSSGLGIRGRPGWLKRMFGLRGLHPSLPFCPSQVLELTSSQVSIDFHKYYHAPLPSQILCWNMKCLEVEEEGDGAHFLGSQNQHVNTTTGCPEERNWM